MLIMGDFQTLSYWHGDREKLAIFPEKKTLSLKPLIIRFFSLVAYLQISAPLIILKFATLQVAHPLISKKFEPDMTTVLLLAQRCSALHFAFGFLFLPVRKPLCYPQYSPNVHSPNPGFVHSCPSLQLSHFVLNQQQQVGRLCYRMPRSKEKRVGCNLLPVKI